MIHRDPVRDPRKGDQWREGNRIITVHTRTFSRDPYGELVLLLVEDLQPGRLPDPNRPRGFVEGPITVADLARRVSRATFLRGPLGDRNVVAA